MAENVVLTCGGQRKKVLSIDWGNQPNNASFTLVGTERLMMNARLSQFTDLSFLSVTLIGVILTFLFEKQKRN